MLGFDQVQNNWVSCPCLSSTTFFLSYVLIRMKERICRRKLEIAGERHVIWQLGVLLTDHTQILLFTLVGETFHMNTVDMYSCDRINMYSESISKSMSWFFFSKSNVTLLAFQLFFSLFLRYRTTYKNYLKMVNDTSMFLDCFRPHSSFFSNSSKEALLARAQASLFSAQAKLKLVCKAHVIMQKVSLLSSIYILCFETYMFSYMYQ